MIVCLLLSFYGVYFFFCDAYFNKWNSGCISLDLCTSSNRCSNLITRYGYVYSVRGVFSICTNCIGAANQRRWLFCSIQMIIISKKCLRIILLFISSLFCINWRTVKIRTHASKFLFQTCIFFLLIQINNYSEI